MIVWWPSSKASHSHQPHRGKLIGVCLKSSPGLKPPGSPTKLGLILLFILSLLENCGTEANMRLVAWAAFCFDRFSLFCFLAQSTL